MRLIARFGRTGSRISSSRAGRMPTVDRVSFLGETANPSGSMRIRQRLERGLEVEERLAHPHHDDVPGGGSLRRLVHDGGRLAEDLPGPEVPLVTRDSRQAEAALERAAGLGGDADGASPLLGM
jgi:hypothetical protein